METFTEWLRKQMRQQDLDCRQLADGAGLSIRQIRRAVEKDEPPSVRAVQRLAAYFGADEEETVQLATEQVAASEEEARTPQERQFVCALYRLTPAQLRTYSRELETRVRAAQAEAQGAPGWRPAPRCSTELAGCPPSPQALTRLPNWPSTRARCPPRSGFAPGRARRRGARPV